jgi:hypothetical protein
VKHFFEEINKGNIEAIKGMYMPPIGMELRPKEAKN